MRFAIHEPLATASCGATTRLKRHPSTVWPSRPGCVPAPQGRLRVAQDKRAARAVLGKSPPPSSGANGPERSDGASELNYATQAKNA